MRRAAVLVAGLALLVAAPARGQGSGSPSSYTIPMEVRQLTAVSELRQNDGGLGRWIYAQLIPRGYSMPVRPLVEMHIVDIGAPQEVPGVPYNDYSRWMEGDVSIRVKHGSEEGWYGLYWPVTSGFEFDLGRGAGLPKVSADMSMTARGTGWLARASVNGRELLSLEWHPGGAAGSAAADAVRAGRSGDPFLALNPTLQGPQLYITRFTPQPRPPATSLPAPDTGTIHYRLDPDQNHADAASKAPLPDLFAPGHSLADLIPSEGSLPGVHWHAVEDLLLESGPIGSGGGYSGRAGGTPPTRTRHDHRKQRRHRRYRHHHRRKHGWHRRHHRRTRRDGRVSVRATAAR